MGVEYEGANGIDYAKFPQGLKFFAEQIKERGLKPALWIGGAVPNEMPLAKEKPEWFFDYSFRITDRKNLDVSLDEVREYMEGALEFFIKECGFEGIKLDFWSYAFEDSHPLLKNKIKSGYEWRDWWLGEIRKRLPEYGHFQTGCDIVMANPFLAEYFTNYRYGIDISSGNWEYITTNFLWGAACFATQTGDLFVPNSDSIGFLPNLSDSEALFWINYCLISRSLVEIAGWLYQNPDHPRMKWIKKAICCPNNGQNVFFADFDYRNPVTKGPEIWYLKSPHFSLIENNPCLPSRTVALFNIDDEIKEISLEASDLDLDIGDYVVTDIWSLETFSFDYFKRVVLPARSSRLFAINKIENDVVSVLDSNIKIDSVDYYEKNLVVQIAHKGNLELLLSQNPKKVEFNGGDLLTRTEEKTKSYLLAATLSKPGVLKITF